MKIDNLLKQSKKNKDTKLKVCVITLTYNRPEYIKRSFDSLYKRAGCEFDHYVFDDKSNRSTQSMLRSLKKKHGFNLYLNKERMGIFKSFYWNLKYVPLEYDYYVKLDSDVEILSDNLFSEMVECFKYPEKISAVTPRTEGIRNVDRYDSVMQFYGGHAIKNEAPIVYGCCMMFSDLVFKAFRRLNDKELENTIEKWGIDSILYDHAKKIGKFLIIEDLSVYHIDNAYGQRKNNNYYFTDRKRWNIIDNDEVWYMKASEAIYPKFLNCSVFDKMRKVSSNFEDFLKNCLAFLENKPILKEKEFKKEVEKRKSIQVNKQITYMKTMYKVTSPNNFTPDSNMKHGDSKLFAEIPLWAKNNPRLVIEEVKVEETPVEEVKEVERQEELIEKKEIEKKEVEEKIEKKKEIKKTRKIRKKKIAVRKCRKCDYTTTSLKRLKTHKTKKHG